MREFRVPLAWTLFVLTVLLAVTQVTILVRAEAPLFSAESADDGFPLVTLATVVASAIGLLIVTRYPRHRIGWLFLVGQVGTILGLATQSYGFVAMNEDLGSRSLAQWSMWVSLQLGGVFALTLVALLLLLAPDGRLLSPRWRWAVAVVVLGILLHNGAILAVDPANLTAEANAPGTSAIVPFLTLLGGVLLVVGLACGAVSLFKRLRRASGIERAQLRWIAAAATALALCLPVGTLLTLVLDVPTWVAVSPLMAAYLALPICTGVAILRWRLYDIDVILNRSIVFALLTGFVAVGYVAVVVTLAELAHDQAAWPSLLATALVALAFQPARRRASQLASRLVYGQQAVPYETLAGFNDELRHSSSLSDLLPRTAEAVGRVFGADQVRVWIELADDAPTVACWPAGPDGPTPAPEHSVAVSHRGELLGGLALAMPRGRQLRRKETQLLEDLATQLGAAFRAVHLERELAAQVEELARQGQELARSQARLMSAQSEERRRFESAITQQVLPFVAPLPDLLHDLERQAGDGEWPAHEVDRLIGETNSGLEALRALTRGVFPAQLTRRGLASALSSHLDQAAPPHTLEVDDSASGRFRQDVESAAYFCAVELVRHFDGPVRVTLEADRNELVLTVAGRADGRLERATRHLVDRVEALGGAMSCLSRPAGTLCRVALPRASPAPGVELLDQPVGAGQ